MSGNSIRVLNGKDFYQDQDSLCCQENLCPETPLEMWSKFYKSDSRVAFGKYSPLEKEILRLGGIHTVAARKFLAKKQEEEQKMLKELQLLSPDYKQAVEYRKRSPPSGALRGPLKKLWTARVVIPAEEIKVSQRERSSIGKHVQRMQLSRTLENKQLSPSPGKFLSQVDLGPTAKDKSRKDGDNSDSDHRDKTKQEEEKDKDRPTVKRQEIKMDVVFKSEERKRSLECQPKDCKPFLPTRRSERLIAGLTNRNLLSLEEFPGDLMLMSQDFTSRGMTISS
ncbi:uncharacterized protein C10orf120 homolog [Ctenodactylus gundi]